MQRRLCSLSVILGQERVPISTLKSRGEFTVFVLSWIDCDLIKSQKYLLKALEVDKSV